MVLDFDELFVISDLHLGGEPDHQIFVNQAELVALLTHIQQRPSPRRVALVINGDLVDFLAAQDAEYLDPVGAIRRLNNIWQAPAFREIFAELAKLVQTPNRFLAITLGNHDLELALPHVRRHLTDLLCGTCEDAHARLELAFDGSGFSSTVAGKNVLCLHGNEVDDWNVTDWEQLRRAGSDFAQRGYADPWTPNAGTKLVVDIMNSMKQKFAFIDLLKPETEAVLPILVALDDSKLSQIRRLAGVGERLAWDKIRRKIGVLGGEAGEGTAALISAGELMRLVEEHHQKGRSALDLLPFEDEFAQLGLWDDFNDWAGRTAKSKLRQALRRLLDADRSFDFGAPDDTFKRIDGMVNRTVDYVITGHTHLERSLARGEGRGHYFNTGTWAGLMRLDEKVLDNDDSFASFYDRIQSGATIAQLEANGLPVLRRPAVARVRKTGNGVEAELLRVGIKAKNVQFSPVSGGQS